MERTYHKWTDIELERIRVYVLGTSHPYSRYELAELATEMGVSPEAVRGAVGRMATRLRAARDRMKAPVRDRRKKRR